MSPEGSDEVCPMIYLSICKRVTTYSQKSQGTSTTARKRQKTSARRRDDMMSKVNSGSEKKYAGRRDGKPRLDGGDVSQTFALYSSIFTFV